MIEYIPVATLAAAGIVWAIRLEGKVEAHQQLFAEREKQTLAKNAADTERHDELKERLVRIEGKLDSIAYGAIHQSAQNLHG